MVSSTVTINSASEAVASFENHGGLAPGLDGRPELIFEVDGAAQKAFFTMMSQSSIAKPYDITPVTQDLFCSFAGGCSYKIAGSGAKSLLK
jgi:hypothetical protein